MRLILLPLCLLGLTAGLSGCANLAQDIFDTLATDSCYPGNSSEETRACTDRVDQNSRDHSG